MEISGGVGCDEATAVDLALASHEASLDHLIKLVDDGGLDEHDDRSLVAVMQRFERLRNRLPLVDHRLVRDAQARNLADTLAQRSMSVVLTNALRISHGEAARRVRAAEQVGERVAMTGQPLAALRPSLAAAQRSGEANAEQVDIVLRALGRVDHRGFDPADIDAGERLLSEFTASFGPNELKDLAARVVDRIDPDGSVPQDAVNSARRHFAMRKTSDGMYAGEFRLTGALGAKLSAVLSQLAAPRLTSGHARGRKDVDRARSSPSQAAHARRTRGRVRPTAPFSGLARFRRDPGDRDRHHEPRGPRDSYRQRSHQRRNADERRGDHPASRGRGAHPPDRRRRERRGALDGPVEPLCDNTTDQGPHRSRRRLQLPGLPAPARVVRAPSHRGVDRRWADRSGQPHPALPLSPPQLPGARVDMPNDRRRSRMDPPRWIDPQQTPQFNARIAARRIRC